MRPRPPPVAALALSFGFGCALPLSGVTSLPAPILLLTAILLIGLWTRPARSATARTLLAAALSASMLAGVVRTEVWEGGRARDCRLHIPDGWEGPVSGTLLAPPGTGAVPLLVERGLAGCREPVRTYIETAGMETRESGTGAASVTAPPAIDVAGTGRWRRLPPRAWTTPETAGYLVLETGGRSGSSPAEAEPATDSRASRGLTGSVADLRRAALRTRAGVQRRLARLYGPMAPVTEALVLARKEGLDPELRDAFARAGIAHLLAISGFHVGIVAGLLLVAARILGLGPVRAPVLAAAGAWAYVLFIGSPDAAVRAALLLGLLCVGRIRARPASALGALAATFVLFLLADPGALGRVGFQLSFAGTAALILVGGRWSREAADHIASRIPDGASGPWVRGLGGGLGTAIAATVGTLPLVAWHFGQIPLFGIPATLALGPLVALAIPGILATLVLDPVAPGASGFLAGGVGWILELVVVSARWVADLQGDAGWVASAEVLCGLGGAALGGMAFRWAAPAYRDRSPGPWPFRGVVLAGGAAGVLLAPIVVGAGLRGVVEITAVDVGQGDALAIRSPAGRWVLVDTGPRTPSFDAGRERVLPFLRRAGAERVEALVLTHPDLDHIGGAPAVLRGMEVGGVLDPGRAAGRGPFEETLTAARERGVGWWPAGARERLEVDGMELEVLYPAAPGTMEGSSGVTTDANDYSVVLLLRFGRFHALLTGDAPMAVEEVVLDRIDGRIAGPVQLLKVGHHGSRTSTSPRLLEALRPEAAVIPVGWRNRYGHPHDEVVDRLASSGARILRTDLMGTVVIRAQRDGSWTVRLPDGVPRR